MNIRKISIDEFEKLHRLSPKSVDWKKYKAQQLSRFENREIDVYVIEDNENFIGELTVNYVSHDLPQEAIENVRVYLEAYRIDKNLQGQGLGQKLIKFVIDDLIKIGYTEFTIGVEDDNEIAKHIYFKLGFTEAIDKGFGDEFDPSEYTLYLKKIDKIQNTLNKLIDEINLGEIKSVERVYGGLLNRMYKVVTSNGIYAIKYLNPEVMKRPNAIANHTYAEQIANIAKSNGVKCIAANIYNGKALQKIDNTFFLIFDWFDGNPINSRKITFEHVKKVAKQLAILHQIDFSGVENNSNLGKEITEVDWEYYASIIDDEEVKNLLSQNVDYLSDLDKKSTLLALKISNNKVISHRDLDLPNILWDDEENPVFIDWESSGLVNPCEELVETAWDWSGGEKCFDKEKFECFINTYKDNGGDISNLKDAIYANFKNKSGWLEYNLKRVCGIECIDEEEKELGRKEVIRVIKEIRMFYETMEDEMFTII